MHSDNEDDHRQSNEFNREETNFFPKNLNMQSGESLSASQKEFFLYQ